MSHYPGQDWDVINTTVNAATDTEITYTRPVRSFYHRSRNNVELQLRKTNNGTPWLTITPGEKPEWQIILHSTNADSASLGFIRSVGAGDVVETIVTF